MDALVGLLRARGTDIEVVDAAAASGCGTAAAEVVANLDLVWACGLLTAELVADGCPIEVVAAPVFAGETAAVYRSVIVARATSSGVGGSASGSASVPGAEQGARSVGGPLGLADLARLRVAVNETGSWSGYRALLREFGVVRGESPAAVAAAIETDMILTGAHLESVRAVADHRADIAAVDSSIWDWLVAVDPEAVEGVVAVDQTTDWPAPPFSVGGSSSAREALTADLLSLSVQSLPGLARIVPSSIERYRFMTR